MTIGKKGATRSVAQPDMVRQLNLDEKLKKAVPLLNVEGVIVEEAIAGTHPWERYLHLKGLRVPSHARDRRGYDPDPDIRTAYDRLVLGEADDCARDAFEIVQAVRPGFIDAETVRLLNR